MISFDSTNQIGSAGRMVMHIAPTGGFIMRPSNITKTLNPTLADIDTTVVAGGQARVEILILVMKHKQVYW